MADGLGIFCTGYTPLGPRHWRVRHITKANLTDLIILSLDYASPVPPDGRFVQAMVTARLPEIGELVMIAGFRASDEHVPVEEGMCFPVEDGHLRGEQSFELGLVR